MNDLEKYFNENTGNSIHKWKHYFDVYERHFSKFRGKDVVLVEFGVFHGGSLQMWKSYFGDKVKIYGVDINPYCKELEEDQVKIFIGDQSDKKFLAELAREIPKIDILIDDGGHTMRQQINTFEALFPNVKEEGVYLCEDIHTSYWPSHGGGYKKSSSFIEYSKNLIDHINAWHSKQLNKLKVSEFTRTVGSMHYYDSILVIEKQKREQPVNLKSGIPRVRQEIDMTIPARLRRWISK